ncbi:UDP-N-acetylmuramate:L-alanyl-gamma-D-glutamyl-meso-diaminopimelate ligase [Endozoicomonas sp. (ex Bugula neritina AB1)]|nr:UDP-N-acetylmuramate:L-alanyl-gamma-D-glutamyl-meso-diaminopimelate ligase [Endozoicomonas sp. (ex Bugula neritina AB1)]
MHIHILGICGTFMGSLAILARELGFQVSGSDQHVYPPMSTQLKEQGIELHVGYDPTPLKSESLKPAPDLVVIGNAMTRGNPAVEYVLNQGLSYTSGPEFFARYILKDKWVLAASGTHGKTTTSSMLAWILECAGMAPGFLIGGIPKDFGISARMGETSFFVVEADEYDTAFFDKRSKFVHYHPRTLILNNLEFDHADIFDNLAAIQKQFHHVIRTVPSTGKIIYPAGVAAIDEVIGMGCWSEQATMAGSQSEWQLHSIAEDGSAFTVIYKGKPVGEVQWGHQGLHNVANGLSAIAAAHHVGVLPEVACKALSGFQGVKRRMELIGEVNGVHVYDDFAHHPTAIESTLKGLRANLGQQANIKVIIEPRSNTMKMGVHQQSLIDATASASEVIWFQPEGLEWPLAEMAERSDTPSRIMDSTQDIVDYLVANTGFGDHVLIMSNGGFEGLHQRVLTGLKESKEEQ